MWLPACCLWGSTVKWLALFSERATGRETTGATTPAASVGKRSEFEIGELTFLPRRTKMGANHELSAGGSKVSATARFPDAGNTFMTRMNVANTKQMLLLAISGQCPSITP